MLLGWLGGRHGNAALEQASERLENAIAQVLANPANHTPDLGGRNTTEGFGEAVVTALG
jgi:isocitrate/isopropylmalate dehydrogenase